MTCGISVLTGDTDAFLCSFSVTIQEDVSQCELTFSTVSSSGSGVLGETTVLDGFIVLSDCSVGEA